jgi:hypothetical protein
VSEGHEHRWVLIPDRTQQVKEGWHQWRIEWSECSVEGCEMLQRQDFKDA